MKKILVIFCFLSATLGLFADSVKLLNDSPYALKAVIYDANGTLLGEFILNPRDASEWSNNFQNFGTEGADEPQLPYTVNWACMSGGAYGFCNNVAGGSLVTAQGCGGAHECASPQNAPGTPQQP